MDTQTLALRQLADYDRREPGLLFAGNAHPMTLDEAYNLQFEVARLRQLRGERVVGFKIGCVSQVMQRQLGLDRPVFGHIFDTELHVSPAVLSLTRFAGLAVEGEFAVRLAADPTQAIAAAFPVIELHHYVFRNRPHTAQELIGNNAIHAGVVLPQEEPTDPAALEAAPVEVARNGTLLGASAPGDLPGGPLSSVALLAAHLARFGARPLRAGDLILTGSPLPLFPVAAGERIDVTSGGRQQVSASICA